MPIGVATRQQGVAAAGLVEHSSVAMRPIA